MLQIRKAASRGCADKPSVWLADKLAQRPITDLIPFQRNNRTHSAASIAKLGESISTFGFVVPILVDRDGTIIAGHGRYEAARALALDEVPVVVADHLSEPEVRALRIADNKLAELSDWNVEALRIEFDELMDLSLAGDLDFELDVIGFEDPEVDLLINGSGVVPDHEQESVQDPDSTKPTVARLGDLWVLGTHRIFCGNALEPESYDAVLETEIPAMVFTDPPYNVPVNGHVRSGSGGRHREFAMAAGEMSADEFRTFLSGTLTHQLARLAAGGIAMVCMDWRHIEELIGAGKSLGFELINLCVWNKTNGGMGSLYRSKHELIAIFKKPGGRHTNNVELGRYGRNRTNVWDYAGVNSFGRNRKADLADHPTVKPSILVADALMDVTLPGDIVLDPFGGSGSTLLAAERVKRKARLIELDPGYVDLAIRRWQDLSGEKAVHAVSGQTWEQRASAADAEIAEAADVAG